MQNFLSETSNFVFLLEDKKASFSFVHEVYLSFFPFSLVWYQPLITREEAESLLLSGSFPRDFILRKSITKHDSYALAVVRKGLFITNCQSLL